MGWREDCKLALQNHTHAYTTNLTRITIVVLNSIYVILVLLSQHGFFFLIQAGYGCLIHKLFLPRQDLGEGPFAFGAISTVLMGFMTFFYIMTWIQQIEESTSEHWYRDVFVLFSDMLVVVLVWETVIGAVLGVLVGVFRACGYVREANAKQKDE